MRHLLCLLVLCLVLVCRNTEARLNHGMRPADNNFYFPEDKNHVTGEDEDEGSGHRNDDSEDDDDDDGSGWDGSGHHLTETQPVDETCAEKRERVLSSGLLGAFIPRCTVDGKFVSIQCHGSIGSCWCVDEDGVELDNTRTQRGVPRCEETAVFNVVARLDLDYENTVSRDIKYRHKLERKLMRAYQDLFTGSKLAIIINSISPGSVVIDFDVKATTSGSAPTPTESELEGTLRSSDVGPVIEVRAMLKEDRDVSMAPDPEPETTTPQRPRIRTTTEPEYNVIDNTHTVYVPVPERPTEDISNVVPSAEGPVNPTDEDMQKKEEDGNGIGFEQNISQVAAHTGIMAQPGLLAGIIGGAVVGLLFAVLLVMFIVYRMRKKDEGSYALDEPKSPRLNTYTKASNKEFYA